MNNARRFFSSRNSNRARAIKVPVHRESANIAPPHLKLRYIVIALYHAIQEIAAQYQYEQSQKPLQPGQIVIDESSSFQQEHIDYIMAKV